MPAEQFYDHLTPAGDGTIDVLAKISIVRTEDGGRKGPIGGKYRPNHNFGSQDNRSFFIGQIEIPEGQWVQPGETRDLVVSFLNVQGLAAHLTVGCRWRIQEGSKLVANAEVLSVLPAT